MDGWILLLDGSITILNNSNVELCVCVWAHQKQYTKENWNLHRVLT